MRRAPAWSRGPDVSLCNIRASDLKNLNKLLKRAGSFLELIVQRGVLDKMKNLMDNPGPLVNRAASLTL